MTFDAQQGAICLTVVPRDTELDAGQRKINNPVTERLSRNLPRYGQPEKAAAETGHEPRKMTTL
jgi:hypothetical protein